MSRQRVTGYRLATDADWQKLFSLKWEGYPRILERLKLIHERNGFLYTGGTVVSINAVLRKREGFLKVILNPSTGNHSLYVLEVGKPQVAFEQAVKRLTPDQSDQVFRKALLLIQEISEQK